MSEDENVFLKVGFTTNPFNPMGVTKGIDDDVPPPVGVREQLKQTLKFIDEVSSYKDNLLYAVIGPYGSGKSELMKYLYRYSMKKDVTCLYKQFDKRSVNVYRMLKAFTKDQIKEPEVKRLIIFLDEIDDIPRMIQNRTISANDAEKFFKDIRRFLERNDEFREFRSVLLVLGLGKPSWTYMKKYAADISDQRLLGRRPELSEPEDWQMVGLIRRYMYYYANNELRKIMDSKHFYPISEGKSLALARLSALVHPHSHVNTRMVIKLIDRVVYYLAKDTIKNKGKVIRELTFEDIKLIIKKPKILNLAEKKFENALTDIYTSLENSAKQISEQINIEQEKIFDLLFRIYFDHSIITDEEIISFIGTRYLKQIKQLFIENNLINKILIIDKNDSIKGYNRLVNRAIILSEKSQLFLIKRYKRHLDKILSETNFDPTEVPDAEYESIISILERNLEYIQDSAFKELFNSETTEEIILLSNDRWEREIKDKQIGEIKQKGIFEACRKLEALSPNDLMVNFAKNLKNLLKSYNINLFNLKHKSQYEDILCITESPKAVFFVVKDDPNRHFIATAKVYLKDLLRYTKESFEGFIIFNTTKLKEITNDENKTNELITTIEEERKSRDMPYLQVINIPNESVAHMIFAEDTRNESDHKNAIMNVISHIRETQKETREFFKENKRLVLDSSRFKVTDAEKLNKKIKVIWDLIIKGENIGLDTKEIEDIAKFGDEFVFHSEQLLSSVELDLIEIISRTGSTKITRDNVDYNLRNRFALSSTVYNNNEMKLLDILTIKCILVNEKPGAKTQYQYHIFDSTDELNIVEDLFNSKDELNSSISEIPQLITLSDHKIPLVIDFKKINPKLELFADEISELEELSVKIKENAPKRPLSSIDSKKLIQLTRFKKEFDNKYMKLEKDFEKLENEVEKIKEEVKSLISEIRELDHTILVNDVSESINLNEIITEVQNIITDKKINLDAAAYEIKEIKNRVNVQLRRKGEIKKFIDQIREKVKNTNTYLEPLNTLSDLNSKILFYTIENEEIITKITEYFDNNQPESIKRDLLINEIPENVDDAAYFSNWIINELDAITSEAEHICELLKGEVIEQTSPLVNFLDWIKTRNQKIWSDWCKSIKSDEILNDLETIVYDINLKNFVLKRQLQKIADGFEDVNKLMKTTFGENSNLVYKIGGLGPNQAVNVDSLIEEYGDTVVKKTLDRLDSEKLVRTSYVT